MADYPRCRLTTWADVDRWADTVAAKVRAAGRVPGTIVGLTRGGWVPSRLLADRLGVRRVVSLRLQHWGVTATPSGRAELTEGLSGPVDGQEVLVVDDITDTGESLKLAVADVAAHGARRVESATCLHIAHSEDTPRRSPGTSGSGSSSRGTTGRTSPPSDAAPSRRSPTWPARSSC
jgi:hypoxanthine phosphoribosyltransferase